VDKAPQRPVAPHTPLNIGSTTKTFMALAIMQLVEVGKSELGARADRADCG
jgi:CubicO group peptidase (beta-lactamase class C family)